MRPIRARRDRPAFGNLTRFLGVTQASECRPGSPERRDDGLRPAGPGGPPAPGVATSRERAPRG